MKIALKQAPPVGVDYITTGTAMEADVDGPFAMCQVGCHASPMSSLL
jgi:hypothetical protein